MANAMAQMQMAFQAQQLSQQLGGGGGLFPAGGLFAVCQGSQEGQPEENGEEADEETAVVEVPDEEAEVKLVLRMCVYAAYQLPKDKSFVEVGIAEGTPAEQIFVSKASPTETENPVWEFSFEHPISFLRRPPRVEIRIMGKRVLNSSLIGATELSLVGHATDGPERITLKLHIASALDWTTCQPPRPAKLTVTWQLCENAAFQPSLVRVAEMDDSALQKQKQILDVRLQHVSLKSGLRTGQKHILARVRLERGSPSKAMMRKSDPIPLPKVDTAPQHARNKIPLDWQMKKIEFVDKQVNLLTYIVRVSLYMAKPDNSSGELLGSWQELLGDLLSAIANADHRLVFDAALGTPHGTVAGTVRLEMDIFEHHPHKAPPKPKSGEKPVVKVRHGLPAKEVWDQKVQYWCTVWADGIPATGKYRPFVRITMGETSKSSPAKEEDELNDVRWAEAIHVSAKVIERTAKVELLSERGNWSNAELLGEHMIYDVTPDQPYWLHFYGGAVNPTNKGAATSMVKGGIRPASTYRGSVAVQFSSRKMPPTRFYEDLFTKNNSAKKSRLTVKLHRGLYFNSLANKTVTVLVQVAGCRILDAHVTQDLDVHEEEVEGQRSSASAAYHPKNYNRNVLSFPGRIDESGMLTFLPHRDSKQDVECSWVERTTPAIDDFLLTKLPQVTHAYLYIVVAGEERELPKIFGRIRLDKEPCWKRMRIDRSAKQFVQKYFESDLAGFILGSATLVEQPEPQQDAPSSEQKVMPLIEKRNLEEVLPPESQANSFFCRTFARDVTVSVGSPGEEVKYLEAKEDKSTVYYYIDMLAARKLPPTDPDGLCDPNYRIRVGDQQHDLAVEDTTKSLNPDYMRRIVIPVQLPWPHAPGKQGLPLPPVICILRDYDPLDVLRGQTKAAFDEVGTVVVKHPKQLVDTPLDLNRQLEAVWYSIDSPGHEPYDVKTGSVDAAWFSRPRMLLAVGYSLNALPSQKGIKDHMDMNIDGCEEAYYKITVNLLGLRDLPASIHFPELALSSYWAGHPCRLNLQTSDRNPNFVEERPPVYLKDFKIKTQPLLRLLDETDDEYNEKDEEEGRTSRRDDDPNAEKDVVDVDDLLGVHIVPPTYKVAVIPYLQSDPRSHSKKNPNVLMPSLTFQLQNRMTGVDYGTLSLGLKEIERSAGRFYEDTLAEALVEDFKSVPDDWKGVQPIRNFHLDEDTYSCHVDVFAAEAGYVTFDPDLRIGRCISEQKLFSIRPEEGGLLDVPQGARNVTQGLEKKDEDEDDDKEFNQFLNAGDYICNERKYITEPYDARVCPTVYCGEYQFDEKKGGEWKMGRKEDQYKSPLKPEKLFQHYLKSSSHEDGLHFLRDARTSTLHRKLKEKNWRCLSHLTAPEKSDGSSGEEHMKTNLHCFIRPVGHEVSSLDRDSRILCRLRVGLPEKIREDLKKEADTRASTDASAKNRQAEIAKDRLNVDLAESRSVNYLVIKFNYDGLVVWTSPECFTKWPFPGERLLAVLRKDTGQIVPIVVPSFDLRFSFESSWYPVKTVTSRFSTLELKILEQKRKEQMLSQAKLKKKKKGVHLPNKPQADRELEEDEPDAADKLLDRSKDELKDLAKEEGEPDGYGHPILVSKYAFVLRLKKRPMGLKFDRVQTDNWYRTIFGDTYPKDIEEVDKAQEELGDNSNDLEMVKHKILGHFMNLRMPLVIGESQSDMGTVKGHVTCIKLTEKEVEEEVKQIKDRSKKEEVQMTRAVKHFWKRSKVTANVSVLTVHDLDTSILGLDSKLLGMNPYLKVCIGDFEDHTAPVDILPQESGSCFFYHMFHVEAAVPGASTLQVQVWNQSLGGLHDTLLGTATIDLEDRWLGVQQRRLKMSTSKAYLERHVSPQKPVIFKLRGGSPASRKWCDPVLPERVETEDDSCKLIKPHFAEPRFPIERLDLRRRDEQTDTEAIVGSMRFWLEMVPEGVTAPVDNIDYVTAEFEVRVTIWEVDNIKIYMDWGERNDAYVKGRLNYTDYWGQTGLQVHKTDTHRFAQTKATFNYLWIFKVRAPVKECNLELLIMDSDKISRNDCIYDPKVYSLDHLLMLAMRNVRQGKEHLGVLKETVTFDSWPEENHPESKKGCCWCCCRRRPYSNREMFAKLKMEVQVLSKQDADQKPVTQGQISRPADRLDLQTAIANPGRTFKILLGPTAYNRCWYGSICTIILVLLFCLLVMMYYFEQVFGLKKVLS